MLEFCRAHTLCLLWYQLVEAERAVIYDSLIVLTNHFDA